MHALSHRCPDIISFHVENFNLYDYNLQIFFLQFPFFKNVSTRYRSLVTMQYSKTKAQTAQSERTGRHQLSTGPRRAVLTHLVVTTLHSQDAEKQNDTKSGRHFDKFVFVFFFWLNFIYLKYYQQFNIMFFEAIFL